MICSCGCEVRKEDIRRHERTKKHQNALMLNYKATTYEKLEKQPKEKKFKQNSYEEIRKLVEDNGGNNIVKEVKNKKKNNEEIPYNFKLCD